jgi:HK97 gp10 family phage protein
VAAGSVASVRLSLSFKNAAAVAANFKHYDEGSHKVIRELVREAGQYCHDLTVFLCPVDTGFMRDHVRVLYGKEGYSFEVGWLEEDFLAAGLAFYPIFVEFGTRFMAAQPSLVPAYQDTKEWFVPALGDALRDLATVTARQSTRRGA